MQLGGKMMGQTPKLLNSIIEISGIQILEMIHNNSKYSPPGRSGLSKSSTNTNFMDDTSSEVFDRLKKALSLNSDVELAERLGVSKSGLNGYRVRDTIPFAQIVGLCKKESMSLDWILLGQGLRLGEDSEVIDESEYDKLQRQIAVYEDLLQYSFAKLREYESDSWQGPESVLNQIRSAALS